MHDGFLQSAELRDFADRRGTDETAALECDLAVVVAASKHDAACIAIQVIGCDATGRYRNML